MTAAILAAIAAGATLVGKIVSAVPSDPAVALQRLRNRQERWRARWDARHPPPPPPLVHAASRYDRTSPACSPALLRLVQDDAAAYVLADYAEQVTCERCLLMMHRGLATALLEST